MPAKNDSTKPAPLYRVIARELRRQIVRGELGAGEILPSENELCAIYSTTRETVRKGLKELEADGLIFSRPRRGYFVSSASSDQFMLTLPVEMATAESRFLDIHITRPSAEIAKLLELSLDDKIVFVVRGSYQKDELLAVERRYLPYNKGIPSVEREIDFSAYPETIDARTSSFSYYTQLQATAGFAPDDISAMMGLREKLPFLIITRQILTQKGKCLAYSIQYIRQPYGVLGGVSGYQDSAARHR